MIDMMAFITHFYKSTKTCLIALVLLLVSLPAMAEEISVVRAKGTIAKNGQMLVSTRFNTQLPQPLIESLNQGVALNFRLDYQLNAPSYQAYKLKISNLFGSHAGLNYKLSYHPLTNRYKVIMGTLATDYGSLDEAIQSIGAIANWRVLSSGTLTGYPVRDVSASVRLSLSISDLPKPFQINAITSSTWKLDSGWVTLNLSKES